MSERTLCTVTFSSATDVPNFFFFFLVHVCMRVAQNVVQHFLCYSKNQQEMHEIFSWLILNVPLDSAARQCALSGFYEV
jgi:hypothetical protein